MSMAIVILFVFVVGLAVGGIIGIGIGMRMFAERPHYQKPVTDKTIHKETITIDAGRFYKKI